MTNNELNSYALKEYINLKQHKHFDELIKIEEEIKINKDPFDVGFYLNKQDELSYLYGEIENVRGDFSARFERYLADRVRIIGIEVTKNKDGSFQSGEEKIKISSTMLSSAIRKIVKGEIGDLYEKLLDLESKLRRITNAIQTCRNHIYNKKDSSKE